MLQEALSMQVQQSLHINASNIEYNCAHTFTRTPLSVQTNTVRRQLGPVRLMLAHARNTQLVSALQAMTLCKCDTGEGG